MQLLDNFRMVPYGEADDRFYEEPEETLKRIKHSFLYINYAEEYKN